MDPRIREGDQGDNKKGKSEPEALATVGIELHLPRKRSQKDAFATDEHGIRTKKKPVRHFRECGNPYLQQGKNGPPHTRG
jgi:hypothetical protein